MLKRAYPPNSCLKHAQNDHVFSHTEVVLTCVDSVSPSEAPGTCCECWLRVYLAAYGVFTDLSGLLVPQLTAYSVHRPEHLESG